MERSLPRFERARDARLFVLMLGVFLSGGLLASIEALVVPRLKLLLQIDFAEALLVQLIYYAGYMLFAWPATLMLATLGAMRATALGLAIMALGCALFAAAQVELVVPPMLAALLLLSAGVTMLQIACNGIMATRGGSRTAAARFTLLQAFNALGTTIGPLIGAAFLLDAAHRMTPAPVFLAFATGFAGLAVAFAWNRDLLAANRGPARIPSPARLRHLLRRPAMARGAAAIFAYVGAEVTIGTLAVSYLMLPDRANAGAVAAGRLVSLYWAGAMIGRFAGAWALARIGAARLLGGAAIGAVALLAIAIGAKGGIGSAALLAVGLCNSIMFPTIYALAMPEDAADMPAGAMLLCMAVVGGAIVPMATGLVADRTMLAWSLAVPALCYVGIAAFARNVAGHAS